jgi:hypothetical protein
MLRLYQNSTETGGREALIGVAGICR